MPYLFSQNKQIIHTLNYKWLSGQCLVKWKLNQTLKKIPQNEGLCQKSKKLDIKFMPANTQLQNIECIKNKVQNMFCRSKLMLIFQLFLV